ncbi:MAG: hypothetical protein Q8O84_05055 [Nanoarchaeota archaeon]|nr:hypothetical protein [Nanoarchaeota archaeon]
MTSGNFIIGNDLSLKGFNFYVKPNLEKYKAQITDFMIFKGNEFGSENKHLLLSLTGNNNSLEEIVKKSMEEAYNSVEKDEENRQDMLGAWPHQIKSGQRILFETLGVYSDDKTASKVYQNLAVKYSLMGIDDVLEEFENKMSSFAKKFK